jgi:hypothetical protein
MRHCGHDVQISAFTLVSCYAYWTVKTETMCSSETSVDLQCTAQSYIAVVSTLIKIISELGVKQGIYLTGGTEIKFA